MGCGEEDTWRSECAVVVTEEGFAAELRQVATFAGRESDEVGKALLIEGEVKVTGGAGVEVGLNDLTF